MVDSCDEINIDSTKRMNGPSFGGRLMIENQGSSGNTSKSFSGINEEDTKNLAKIERMKEMRRRRSISLSTSMNSAQSEQIKSILEESIGSKIDGVLVEGTPEERLQNVMTHAKDRGLSIEDIFNYFHGGQTGIDGISREVFINALEKLSSNLFVITEKELDELVLKFDLNGDGLISLAEFKKYCLFEIPHVSWKAERKRQEANGQIILLKAKIEEERRAKTYDASYPCGEKVISTSKLFWKNDTTIDVSIYYCRPLDILTIQTWNPKTKIELPLLYVKRRNCKYSDIVDNDASNASINASNCINDDNAWDNCAKYILARLQFKENPKTHEYQIALCGLAGDEFDTITVPKPHNIQNPPKVSDKEEDPNTFDERAASFAQATRRIRRTRDSVKQLESVVTAALSEIKTEEKNSRVT